MTEITLVATLHAIRIDHEGESRATFTIPLSHLENIAALAALTDMALEITVRVKARQMTLTESRDGREEILP